MLATLIVFTHYGSRIAGSLPFTTENITSLYLYRQKQKYLLESTLQASRRKLRVSSTSRIICWSTYIDQTLQQNASLSGLSVKVLRWRWKLLHLVEISRHSSYPRGNLTSTISKSKVDSSQVQIIHATMPHRLPNFVYFVDAQLISQIEM